MLCVICYIFNVPNVLFVFKNMIFLFESVKNTFCRKICEYLSHPLDTVKKATTKQRKHDCDNCAMHWSEMKSPPSEYVNQVI